LSTDLVLLKAARDDAAQIVRDDPTLTAPANAELRQALLRAFAGSLALIDVG
jgi:hypothetical protein